MSEKQLSFEEVNAHFEKADIAQYKAGGKHHFTSASVTTDPSGVLQKICGIYKMVRNILSWILPLLPAKWKEWIKTFMTLMDQLCP